jgi:RHS repeat-associated protein
LHLNKHHTTNLLSLFNGHRFTFNGKEADNDVYGTGNAMDFGARIYDSRLGRWLSVDPVERKFPGISPFNFSFNNPVIFNDPDGKSGRLTVESNADGSGGKITLETTIFLYGPDATTELRHNLNNVVGQMANTALITTSSGQVWEVTINIKYELAPQITPEMINGSANTLPDKVKEEIAYRPGDNVMEINNTKLKPGVGGETPNQGASVAISKNRISSIIEESFHQLGFDERYIKGIGGSNDPDFINNPLGGSDNITSINPVNFLDLKDFAGNLSKTRVLGDAFKVDNTDKGMQMLDDPTNYKARKDEANQSVTVLTQ